MVRQREAECLGKTRYDTKGKALDRIRRHMGDRHRVRVNRGKHVKMEAYRCPHCRFWHVGSTFDRKWLMIQRREEARLAKAERMVGQYVGR